MALPQKVFISYRREGGAELARLIRDALRERGHHVFMDIEDLKCGPFNTALFSEIETCAGVVVILTPGSLDRCADSNDWLRLEIGHALKHGRDIIPIMHKRFAWPILPLPDDIAELRHHQGIESSHEYFSASMDRLSSLLGREIGVRRHGKKKSHNMIYLFAIMLVALAGGYFGLTKRGLFSRTLPGVAPSEIISNTAGHSQNIFDARVSITTERAITLAEFMGILSVGVPSDLQYFIADGANYRVQANFDDIPLRQVLDSVLIPKGLIWTADVDNILTIRMAPATKVFKLDQERTSALTALAQSGELKRIVWGQAEPPFKECAISLDPLRRQLTLIGTEGHIEKMEDYLDAMDPIQARNFSLLPYVDRAAMSTEKSQIAGFQIVEHIKTLLYSEKGMQNAAMNGRNLSFDEEHLQLTVVDTPDNLQRISEYLISLPKFQ
jgi:hypothetical protein